MPPPHLAALRQIAHEVLKSLERQTRPVDIPEAAPSRNGPCPCGSGKKYKKCCEGVAN